MSGALPEAGESVADTGERVLPILPYAVLDDIFSRLTPFEAQNALRHKLVPAAWLPKTIYYAALGKTARQRAEALNLKLVGEVAAHDYRKVVRHRLGGKLIAQATHRLARFFPHYSASQRLTPVQGGCATLLISAAVFCGLVFPHTALIAASLLFSLFFLSLIALRLMCLLPRDNMAYRARMTLDDAALPVYSVLVPLFRETSVLEQLVGAMGAFDYPVDKLDIKLVLEEEDIVMQRALARMQLPEHFEIIVVPAGKPQTKPRALNYALNFARGELLTIYDAEDVPDPGQLRTAAETFAVAPPELACLQARLRFFNADESWQTRQFAVEYASLFGVLLPTLAAEELPLPLGGTSNHFRMSILDRLAGWDPFNVTEDADLGMRLARAGFITGVIDSDTIEEANNDPASWVKQRSRWLKGFLQTWLVHMRQPIVTLQELGFAGFWVFQAMTMGVFLSALLHPVFLGVAIYVLASGRFLDDTSLLSTTLAGLNMAVLLPGYAVSMLLGKRALEQQGVGNWKFTIATLPIYWFMMMPAAWLALWDFVVNPFHWRKTQHGHARPPAVSGSP